MLALPWMPANGEDWKQIGSYDLWALIGTVSFDFFVDQHRIVADGEDIKFVLRVPSLGGGYFFKTLHGNCDTGHVLGLWSYDYDTEAWIEDSVKAIDLDRTKTWEPLTKTVCRL